MRRLVLILLTLSLLPLMAVAGNGVPKKSVILDGLDIDSMRVRLDETDMQPLEGIWYYPNEEMTLGIERYRGKHNIGYRIILLDSPDINVMPGTVIGYIATSAVDSKYQLWLYSQRDKLTLKKPLECVATLNKDATTFTFDPPRWKVKVRLNVARFLPTLFRGVSIIPEMTGETLPVGFRKIYPEGGADTPFNRIRYL
ncbi:MAG: hypothetical protein IJS04_02000 [Muribaculaceae bacterium]|nr:hypothetical protein [Muribaculaceae bacterium]MBQ7204593.1 hypothetical protein [Muribaculaceae bacterium]